MEKWELARYLIDAKKSVDAILYLAQHGEKVSTLNIRNVVNELRRTFYVNVCVVLDKCFPKEKKEICKIQQLNLCIMNEIKTMLTKMRIMWEKNTVRWQK